MVQLHVDCIRGLNITYAVMLCQNLFQHFKISSQFQELMSTVCANAASGFHAETHLGFTICHTKTYMHLMFKSGKTQIFGNALQKWGYL